MIILIEVINLPSMNWLVVHLMILSLNVMGLADVRINVVFRWFLCLVSDQFVGVSGSASKDLILNGNMTSVAWQVVFLVLNECFFRHF